MADFAIKAHDRLPAIRAQLLSASDEQPVDLTAAQQVRFIMVTQARAVIVNAVAVIEAPATLGIVRYDWIAADTATAGSYLGEWEVTWTGGKKQTFPTATYHTIDVLADLDGV